MEKDGTRQRMLELIASLECHIQALESYQATKMTLNHARRPLRTLGIRCLNLQNE
jgi:hypothetical protein